jgi:hypothetical protein
MAAVTRSGGPGSSLDVRGGAGGIAVRIDDLQTAAGSLERVAAGVAEVSVRAGAVAADPRLVLSGLLAPGSLAAVEEGFAAALLGPAGATAAGVRVAVLAVRLRAAAAGYAATETRVLLLVSEIEAGLRGRPGELTVALADLAAGIVPGGGPTVARLLAAAGRVSPAFAEGAAVDVTSSEPVVVPPAAGVGDLLGLVAEAYPAGGAPPGSVVVQRVERPGGSRAWVVAIPGTQEWGPVPASDPLDLTAGVTSLAAGPTAASALVVRALDLAGARRGEPVLLAGHSLGGMLAAQLAADPAVRDRFSVACVVTAGSPVARYPVPESIPVLSLEHADDVVPALDGEANPDRAGWVTVRRPSGAREYPPDPGGAHDAGAYAATGALVDASADPSLVAWRAALAPFVAAPGVTAVRIVVTGRRVRRVRLPRQRR